MTYILRFKGKDGTWKETEKYLSLLGAELAMIALVGNGYAVEIIKQ